MNVLILVMKQIFHSVLDGLSVATGGTHNLVLLSKYSMMVYWYIIKCITQLIYFLAHI